MIVLNLALKRWVKYVAILLVVFVLCWQNSADSTTVTNTTVRMVQKISNMFGKDLEYSENLYYLIRKIGHGLVFLVLAFAGHLAIAETASTMRAAVITSFTMGIIIAILTELMQAYAFDRRTSLADAGINVAGTILGILLGLLFEWLRKLIAAKKAETV